MKPSSLSEVMKCYKERTTFEIGETVYLGTYTDSEFIKLGIGLIIDKTKIDSYSVTYVPPTSYDYSVKVLQTLKETNFIKGSIFSTDKHQLMKIDRKDKLDLI